MANKGSPYERHVCDLLSAWWTGSDETRVFWRSATSGGAATVRGRKGKKTANHYGDITSSDASALKFLKLVSVELKRGYTRATFMDLLDYSAKKMSSPRPPKPCPYELFIDQAMTAAEAAGAHFWMVIHRRDGKDSMVFVPAAMTDHFHEAGVVFKGPVVRAKVVVRRKSGKVKLSVVGCRLETFLSSVTRKDVKALLKLLEGR